MRPKRPISSNLVAITCSLVVLVSLGSILSPARAQSTDVQSRTFRPSGFPDGFEVVALWADAGRSYVALHGERSAGPAPRHAVGIYSLEGERLVPAWGEPLNLHAAARPVWGVHPVDVVPSSGAAPPWLVVLKTHWLEASRPTLEARWDAEPDLRALSFDRRTPPLALAELPTSWLGTYPGGEHFALRSGARPTGAVAWRDTECTDPVSREHATTGVDCPVGEWRLGVTLFDESGTRPIELDRLPVDLDVHRPDMSVVADDSGYFVTWWRHRARSATLHAARIARDGTIRWRRQHRGVDTASLVHRRIGLSPAGGVLVLADRSLSERPHDTDVFTLGFDVSGRRMPLRVLRSGHAAESAIVRCGESSWITLLTQTAAETTLDVFPLDAGGSPGPARRVWQAPSTRRPQVVSAWPVDKRFRAACDGPNPMAAIVHTQAAETSLVTVRWSGRASGLSPRPSR